MSNFKINDKHSIAFSDSYEVQNKGSEWGITAQLLDENGEEIMQLKVSFESEEERNSARRGTISEEGAARFYEYFENVLQSVRE